MGAGMKKKSSKSVAAFAAVLMLANVFGLTGCGKTENTGSQTDQEVQSEISETEHQVVTGGIMRAYSDKEKGRMAKQQQPCPKEGKPRKIRSDTNRRRNTQYNSGHLCGHPQTRKESGVHAILQKTLPRQTGRTDGR